MSDTQCEQAAVQCILAYVATLREVVGAKCMQLHDANAFRLVKPCECN